MTFRTLLLCLALPFIISGIPAAAAPEVTLTFDAARDQRKYTNPEVMRSIRAGTRVKVRIINVNTIKERYTIQATATNFLNSQIPDQLKFFFGSSKAVDTPVGAASAPDLANTEKVVSKLPDPLEKVFQSTMAKFDDLRKKINAVAPRYTTLDNQIARVPFYVPTNAKMRQRGLALAKAALGKDAEGKNDEELIEILPMATEDSLKTLRNLENSLDEAKLDWEAAYRKYRASLPLTNNKKTAGDTAANAETENAEKVKAEEAMAEKTNAEKANAAITEYYEELTIGPSGIDKRRQAISDDLQRLIRAQALIGSLLSLPEDVHKIFKARDDKLNVKVIIGPQDEEAVDRLINPKLSPATGADGVGGENGRSNKGQANGGNGSNGGGSSSPITPSPALPGEEPSSPKPDPGRGGATGDSGNKEGKDAEGQKPIEGESFEADFPVYGSWGVDFGGGLIASTLRDASFYTVTNAGGKKRIRESIQDTMDVRPAITGNALYRLKGDVSLGVLIGIQPETPLRYLTGLGIVIGRENRLTLMLGAAFGKVTRLERGRSGGLLPGDTLETRDVVRSGGFIGASYTISLK